MIRFFSVLILLLVSVHSSMGQSISEQRAKRMVEHVDSIYDRLHDSDKRTLAGLYKLPYWDLAENRHHFIRASIQDFSLYSNVLRLYGKSIVDFYLPDYATQNLSELRAYYNPHREEKYWENSKKFPLGYLATKDGSTILYILAVRLKDNHNSLYLRNKRQDNWKYYLSRKAKSYSLHDAQSMAELHRYSEAYSYLSAKDDTLYSKIKNFYKGGYDGQITKMATEMLVEKRQLLGHDHPCYALTLSDMSLYYCMRKCYINAIRLQKEAFNIYRKTGNEIAIRLAAKHLSYLYYKSAQNIKDCKEVLNPSLDILDQYMDYNEMQDDQEKELHFFTTFWRNDTLPSIWKDKHLSIYDRQETSNNYSYQELMLSCRLIMKELSIIEPVLGKNADEVQAAHHELVYFSRLKSSVAFYEAEDSLPKFWASEKMTKIKKNVRFSGGLYEGENHFLRASIHQLRLLNSIRDILPPALCDTIMSCYSPEGVFPMSEKDLATEEDTIFNIHKFHSTLFQTIYYLFHDYSNQSWRSKTAMSRHHKQYNLFEMQPIVDAHRYDQKHAFMESKDDSIQILILQNLPKEAFMLGKRLLKEKERTFGENHPIYALAQSDMAFLYVRLSRDKNEDEDSCYDKAIKLQTSAMRLYQKLHMPLSCQLSAKFLSYLYYLKSGFNNVDYNTPIDKLQSLIQFKKEEIAITRPILGDSAFEIEMAKKELELLNEYILREDLSKNRHENHDSLRFQEAVTLYHEGKYAEARSLFADIQEEEKYKYKYLPIRKNYTRQWEAACCLQLGDTLIAKTIDPYFALGPIDRSKTLELDYLCAFEPSNPAILPLIHETFSSTPMQHARMLLQTGEIMINKNQMDCACKCLLLSKSLCKDLLGDNAIIYARILNTLGDLYTSLHYYQEAAYTLEELLSIEARNVNKSSNQYQATLDKIINLSEKGNDKKIIMKWQQEKLVTNNSLDVYYRCVLLDSIAGYFAGSTQQDSVSLLKAIDYLKQSVALLREWNDSLCRYHFSKFIDYSNKHLDLLFDTYAQLAVVYSLQGRTNDIRCLVHESLEWLIKLKIKSFNSGNFDDEDSFSPYKATLRMIADQLQSYFIVFYIKNQCDFLMELAGYAKVINKEYEKYNLFTHNFIYFESQQYNGDDFFTDLAISREYFKQKNYDGCVQVLQKAIPLMNEYTKIQIAQYIGMPYFLPSLDAIGRVEEATSLLREWWQFESDTCLKRIALMNGSQRETFWNETKSRFERMMPYIALSLHGSEIGSILYDNALLCKGLLLNTEMEIDCIITQNGNNEQSTLYKKLRNGQLQLMSELEKPSSFRSVDTDSLRASLRTLEHELLASLQKEKSTDIVRSLHTTWQDVGKNLNKDDIALEFVDVPMGKDSIQYIALVLRKDYDMPHMIPLFTQKDLEALNPVDYYGSPKLYDLLWRPLVDELHGIKNIYFSPSASLHQIGIEYLPGMENYSMYRLSSTRELVNKERNQDNQIFNAALYGGLKFELTDTERSIIQNEQAKTLRTFRDTPDLTSLRDLRGAARQMPVLEGSRREVTAIDSLMRLRHIDVTTATGTTGTEESFKALSGKGKSLLHISTHGFYQPGPKQTDEIIDDDMAGLMGDNTQVQTMEDLSLSRSGLLMTGAADYIFGRMEDHMTEDGILTAREISRMDLKGLDLVVLSACETGLGDISGEGVFGLQRGFKKAGANTMLVSLWKVEDEATQLLMTEFYRNLLSGQTKRQAFFNAQQTLRHADGGKFDRYECWAAFVMVDGLK